MNVTRCSVDRVSQDGCYIYENGSAIYLYVGPDINSEFVEDVFGVLRVQDVRSLMDGERDEELLEFYQSVGLSTNSQFGLGSSQGGLRGSSKDSRNSSVPDGSFSIRHNSQMGQRIFNGSAMSYLDFVHSQFSQLEEGTRLLALHSHGWVVTSGACILRYRRYRRTNSKREGS